MCYVQHPAMFYLVGGKLEEKKKKGEKETNREHDETDLTLK